MSSDEDEGSAPDSPSAAREERASNLGCGFGLLVAGFLLVASKVGWLRGLEEAVFGAAIIFGFAAYFLYKAFGRS